MVFGGRCRGHAAITVKGEFEETPPHPDRIFDAIRPPPAGGERRKEAHLCCAGGRAASVEEAERGEGDGWMGLEEEGRKRGRKGGDGGG